MAANAANVAVSGLAVLSKVAPAGSLESLLLRLPPEMFQSVSASGAS